MKTHEASGRLSLLTAILLATATSAAFCNVFHSAQDIAFSPDGSMLAVGDATAHSLSLIDSATTKVTRCVELKAPPAGLVWSSNGRRVFVSESGAGGIAEVDSSSGVVTRRIETSRYPRGLALAANRNLLFACDWGLDRLVVVDLATGKMIKAIPVGCQPTSVAVSPDESLAVVSNLLPRTAATDPGHAAEITLVDLETLTARPAVRLPTGSSNTRGVAINANGAQAYVVHTLGRFHLPTTQLDRGWVNTNALSIIDLKNSSSVVTVLLDQVMDGAADPWGVAMDPQGAYLYITLAGVHQVAVINLAAMAKIIGPDPASLANDLSALHRGGVIRRVDLPAKGPRGIDVSPDGSKLSVAGYFSGNVVLLDHGAANPVSVPLGPQPEPDLVRRGEIAFHDAELCFQRWLSCATCHPDARADGLNWDLLNDGIGNPKNAKSMLLSHATPPMMSLGVRDKMETAVRAGFVHIQFTEPGQDVLDAVSAYLASLQPVVSPHRLPDGSLSEAAARGEKIFNRRETSCSNCHSGPLLTNLKLQDVGTAGPRDGGVTKFDTPTLAELWRNPPYLHDGSAATLREVLVERNPDDDHGTTSSLSSQEIDDLIQYLLSL